MPLDDIQGNISKAFDMREKLLRNKKSQIKEESISLWEKGFLKDYELADRINDNATRESFMYYSLLIYEMREQSRNIAIENMKKFNFSC